MSTPATLEKEAAATLRHHLRTALNHIVGYAEMLLEEDGASDAPVVPDLESVRDTARRIQQVLAVHLPAGEPVTEERVQQLREHVGESIASVMRAVGSLTQALPSKHLIDLLRINVAAGELLAFAEGALRIEPHKPAVTRLTARRPVTAPGYLLVVDDNDGNRDMLSRQLQRQGHVVEVVENGEDALRQLRQKPYDLVLLDVLMPGMDGLAVLERIKSDTATQAIAVVMISALDELDQVAECLEAGADDYVMKPFDATLLRARITASLERKRLRDHEMERSKELARANEELQQFAWVASHDLQEPLRTMAVYAQLLMRRWADRMDKDSELFLNFIVDGARRMQALVEDVLALSRVSSNDRAPVEAVSLDDVVREVLSDLRASIAETGAAIQHEALPAVIADRAEIVQLFQNLIANAIKYRNPAVAPQIHISALRDDGSFVFAVADNGIGINPEYAEEVFLPFKRLHGREIPGTGIGLALCRRIVERHCGRIWVEPRAGGGSVFRFTLPAG